MKNLNDYLSEIEKSNKSVNDYESDILTELKAENEKLKTEFINYIYEQLEAQNLETNIFDRPDYIHSNDFNGVDYCINANKVELFNSDIETILKNSSGKNKELITESIEIFCYNYSLNFNHNDNDYMHFSTSTADDNFLTFENNLFIGESNKFIKIENRGYVQDEARLRLENEMIELGCFAGYYNSDYNGGITENKTKLHKNLMENETNLDLFLEIIALDNDIDGYIHINSTFMDSSFLELKDYSDYCIENLEILELDIENGKVEFKIDLLDDDSDKTKTLTLKMAV